MAEFWTILGIVLGVIGWIVLSISVKVRGYYDGWYGRKNARLSDSVFPFVRKWYQWGHIGGKEDKENPQRDPAYARSVLMMDENFPNK